MKNTLVIQIRVKMALSAPKRVLNTIACVNRDGLETTVNWILMNVVEVGVPSLLQKNSMNYETVQVTLFLS